MWERKRERVSDREIENENMIRTAVQLGEPESDGNIIHLILWISSIDNRNVS